MHALQNKTFRRPHSVVVLFFEEQLQGKGECVVATTIEVEKQISPLRNSQRARVAPVEMTVVQFVNACSKMRPFAGRTASWFFFSRKNCKAKANASWRTTIEVEKQISPLRNSQRARVALVEMTVVQVEMTVVQIEMTVVQFVREKQRRWGRLCSFDSTCRRVRSYDSTCLRVRMVCRRFAMDILRKKWALRAPLRLDSITFFRCLRDHGHHAFHFL